jgi:hypothetical protein
MLQRQLTITKSLRAAHPKINVPESICGDSKHAPSIYGDTLTIFTAAEFGFDDTNLPDGLRTKKYLFPQDPNKLPTIHLVLLSNPLPLFLNPISISASIKKERLFAQPKGPPVLFAVKKRAQIDTG